jgi:hypothetical protein
MSQPTPTPPTCTKLDFRPPPPPPSFRHAAEIAGAVRLAQLGPATLQWFWPQRIPLGRVTLLAGDPGIGKSLLALDIAARASRGKPWPDEQGAGSKERGVESTQSDSSLPAPCSVLLLTAEDDLADTVRPRLEALGADAAKVVAIPANPGQHAGATLNYSLSGHDAQNTKPLRDRAFELRRDLARLDQLLRAMPDCRLVIVDPISAYLGDVNEQANSEVRGLMLPLAVLAHEHNVAVLAVTHLRKKEGAAIYRAMGSLAFVAAARAAWLVAKDPKQPQRRLFMPLKNNLAADTSGLAFKIESDLTTSQPIIRWSPDPVDISADSIVGNARPRGRPDAEREDAMDWLRKRLANGAAPASDIQEEANAHGIKETTLRRAFRELRGEAVKAGEFLFAQWMWRLPAEDRPASHEDGQN